MFKISLSILLTVCLALAVGNAQALQDFKIANTTTVGWAALPVLGFVVDAAHALRPLVGIAGAASVGSALTLGFDISEAQIPQGHAYFLAMTPDHGWPVWIQVRPGTMTIRPMISFVNRLRMREADCLEPDTPRGIRDRSARRCAREPVAVDLSASIDRAALSPGGSAAALYSASAGRIYVFNNMSESPTLVRQFEAGMPGPVTAMGISDDGRAAAIGVSDGVTGALFVLGAAQTLRFVVSLRNPSAIQFLRNSDQAIVADSVDNRIYSLQGAQIHSVATASDGIALPVAIALSNDNQKVFVANSESASVVTIGLDGSGSTQMGCNCALTGLHPTNTDSVFRLTDFSGRPIVMFHGNSAVPRITLVPVSSEF